MVLLADFANPNLTVISKPTISIMQKKRTKLFQVQFDRRHFSLHLNTAGLTFPFDRINKLSIASNSAGRSLKIRHLHVRS